jgi:hypothetical protein
LEKARRSLSQENRKVDTRHIILAVLLGMLAGNISTGFEAGVQARDHRPTERPKALVERIEKPRHA